MARVTTVTVSDDLDGGPADETVQFCLDGASYEIDLSTANAHRLREFLGQYLTRAAPLITAATAQSATAPGTDTGERSNSAVLRAWAVANGHPVSRVGRVPARIEHAYARAGNLPTCTHYHRTTTADTAESSPTRTTPEPTPAEAP